MKIDFSKIKPHLFAILAIIIVNIITFLPQFQGKVPSQGDSIQHVGMSKEIADYREKTGKEALWTNSMFGGMPAYQISLKSHNNLLQYVEDAMQLYFPRPAGYFIAGMIGFYILMLLLGASPWVSFIGTILFGFTTNNFVLFEAGHNSKVLSLMTSPLVIAGIILAFRQKYLLGAAIFGIAFGVNIGTNHPQMTYYLGLCMGIFVIFEFVKAIKNHNLLPFAKSLGILIVIALLAVGSSASKLWTTYEYTQETMRGGAVLSNNDVSNNQTKSNGGLEWDYAMQWSNGTGDILATFIPKAVGGATGEWVDGDSQLAKAVGQRKGFQGPVYWGDLPFTSGPAYFGIIAIFLCILGMFISKSDLKWWLFTVILLTILMSFGKHLAFFNEVLFNNLPLLNKFRAPSSILSITAIFIPILAVLTVVDILKLSDRKEILKPLYYTSGAIVFLLIVLYFGGTSFFDFKSAGDDRYEQIKDLLVQYRIDIYKSSILRCIVLIGAITAVIWGYIKSYVPAIGLTVGIALISFIDLVPIGKDYFNKSNFVSETTLKKEYIARDADLQIMQDNDPNFRVLDVTENTFNTAKPSYFYKTIGGYHPAKLQRYQDIIDNHIAKNNMAVLNMLNTKYFIVKGKDGQPFAQRNPAATGNAWFVNELKVLESSDVEIDSLTNFDPLVTAFTTKEFESYIQDSKFNKEGSIQLTSYSPNTLEYTYNTPAEQFAVFSEIFYGPNKGWQAFVDGKEVDHIRVNYILRGMKLPAGQHTVSFTFHPKSYFTGEMISLICSLSLLLLGCFVVFKSVKDTTNEPNNA